MERLFLLINHVSLAIIHADNLQTIRRNELKSNETCFAVYIKSQNRFLPMDMLFVMSELRYLRMPF